MDSGVRVHLASGSRADSVVFDLDSSPLFYGLSVTTCNGSTMWTVAQESSAPIPARIVYGRPPAGYTERAPAKPLVPGCYRVTVSGPSSVEFRVESDGTIRPSSADTAAHA
jgi:hypothetical protein